ncbi:MAG: hypothetical protein CMI31_03350 [Opitutae bacterium]|nr:hypothetical protein [Opitutae bacterium]
MDSNELLTILADLKKNRRIATEVTPLIDPLREQSYNLKLIFASASRTFGHNFGSKYDNGYTALCKTEEGEVEVSVMFPERTNSYVEKMEAGHTFDAEITLLDFDALYQRAILGCAAEELATIDDTPEADEAPEVEEMPAAEEKTMETSAMEEEVWGVDPHPKTPANSKFRAVAGA